MRFTPLTEVDQVELLGVWNDASEFDPLTLELLAEKLNDGTPSEPALGLALVENGSVAGWALGVTRESPDALRGHVKLLAVAPPYQGRGYGSKLLAQIEIRLQAAGARVLRIGESAPNYLTPGVDMRYTRCLSMLERTGYAKIGETYNLTASLIGGDFSTSADEQRLAAEGTTVRRAAENDRPALARLLAAHWPAWQQEVALALQQTPPAVHLAIDGRDAPLGFAAYDGNNLGTGWFGPMGTTPAAEGRGIGRTLLRRCLQDLQRQGLPRAIIPWVGPVQFYAKHAGAEIDRVFFRYEKVLSDASPRSQP